ncbi:MAG: sulfotransferase domain-containing protein [Mariniblastus sp.]|nr:sulfotransferase domain-containing protein [Mariniblastus sp.]
MNQPLLTRIQRKAWRIADRTRLRLFPSRFSQWPCLERKRLVVGCESSGTTIIAKSLFGKGRLRFLIEGQQSWVWDARSRIFQGLASFEDYPHLRLFDTWKVPGFAPVLPQLRTSYPNCATVYVVRNPRDVVASAFRTFQITSRDEFSKIPWVQANWLGIKEMDPFARLAMRWRIYLEQSAKVDRVHYVRYEDFCDNKVETIRHLAEFLDLKIDLGFVRSICNQQASNRSARSYPPQGPNSWQSVPAISAADIEKVEQICGPHLAAWGYE